MLWTVARFPNGFWSTGGKPSDPDYSDCWVTVVNAKNRDDAKREGQRLYRNEQRRNKNKAP